MNMHGVAHWGIFLSGWILGVFVVFLWGYISASNADDE